MADMETKRAALATLLTTTLVALDSGFSVDERLRDVVIKGSTRRDRNQVMGDPVRYAVVYFIGRDYPSGGDETDLAGRPLDATDVFNVQIWHGWEDADTYSLSSQAAWDTLTTGAAGVLEILVATEWLSGAGALSLPGNIDLDLVDLDEAGDLAHYLTFNISVT